MNQFQNINLGNYRRPEFSIDELVEKRLTGWKAEEWLFLSMLGQLSILDGRDDT